MVADHSAMRSLLVVVDHVFIRYPGVATRAPVLAVEDVSLSIFEGEKFVILGPSGCGKSTLLTAIGGFMTPSAGTITVDGKLTVHPSISRIMVFQDFGQLFPWRTVIGNVAWAIGRRWPSMPRAERRERAAHYVALVGLSAQAEQYTNTLSGGQKQRCAIARSFAVEPRILLMDEPFGALDAINRERMQLELNRLLVSESRKTTVAFVTHDVNEAVHLGDRILVMSQGPGRVRALIDNPEVGSPPHTVSAMKIAADLREFLKHRPGGEA